MIRLVIWDNWSHSGTQIILTPSLAEVMDRHMCDSQITHTQTHTGKVKPPTLNKSKEVKFLQYYKLIISYFST